MSLILRRDKESALTRDELDDNLVYLENNGGGGGVESLRYIAALTQTDTNAPVATVIRNDFDGELVWSRVDTGLYLATLTGIGIGQVRVKLPEPTLNFSSATIEKYTGGVNDNNSIYLNTGEQNTSTGEISESDELLYGEGFSYIEIIKYL